jgi:tRNA modification GTPase
MHSRDETIFALSSGRPPSAIAIVRVSGPQAGTVLTALAGKLPVPRMATRALIRDSNRQPIDDAVVLWFPGPASATGEDLAEFHVHGGRAVLAALFAALGGFYHVRAAEANLPAARLRTASSILRKPKGSTTSFMPIPTGNAARRCAS